MTRKRYTDSEISIIKNLYFEGKTTVEISNILKKSQSGIERLLKREGLYKKLTHRHSIPHDQDNLIVKMYTDGFTSSQIAKKYNVTSNSILGLLRRKGIDTSFSSRKDIYSPVSNLNYFEEINTEIKAWLLGFIFADGNITVPTSKQNSSIFQLEVHSKDIEVLHILCDETGLPLSKIHSSPKRNTVKVSFYSNTFCNHLYALGCVPKKAHSIEYPKIPQELNRHFIRGLIDGDGSVTNSTIALYGNKNIINKYASLIITEANVDPLAIKYYKTSCYSARVHQKNNRLKLASYLYDDATVYLKRKAKFYLAPTQSDL